jgi:hypothetical protein
MKIVAIVGSRHRVPKVASDNIALISQILLPLISEPITVLSLGCDQGFGKDVKDFCNEQGISFAESIVWFNGPRSQAEFNHLFLSRNAAIAWAATEFHLVVSAKRNTHVEDLLARVKELGKPFTVYNEKNEIVEYET